MRTTQYFKKIRKIISLFISIIFLLSILNLTGCKATEAEPAGYIKNPGYMYKDPTLPFHKVWIRRNFNLRNYNKIMINPINMNYLQEAGKLSKFNFYNYDANLEENKKYLAQYTQQALINAFRYTADNRFKLTNRRGYGTLVLKMAIVSFIPNKSVVNSVGTGLLFVPIVSIPLTIIFGLIALPVKATLRATTDSGFEASIAIEAVLCDSVTNKVLVAFADRVSAPASIIHLHDYHYWAHLEEIIQNWGVQIVQLMNRERKNQKIKGHDNFVFKPW
jgi:hypothetical protein